MVSQRFKTQPVSFLHYLRADVLLPMILMMAGLGAKLYFLFSGFGFVVYIIVAGSILLASVVWMMWSRVRATVELTIGENAMAIQRGPFRHQVRWDEASSIAIEEKPIFANQRSLGEQIEMTLSDGDRRFRAAHFSKTEPNPFKAVMALILKQHARAWLARVRQGRVIRGRGWELDGTGLTTRGRQVPWSELSRPMWGDGRLKIWKRGVDEPILDIPNKSGNAYLFFAIAENLARGEWMGSERGRLRHVVHRGQRYELVFFAGFLALFPLICWFAWLDSGEPALLAIALPSSLAVLAWLARALTRRYHFYENGLAITTLFGQRYLAYDAVSNFHLERREVNHWGPAPRFLYKITLWREGKGRVGFGFMLERQPLWLEEIAHTIGMALLPRLRERLAHGVTMGSRLYLRDDGLYLSDQKMIRVLGQNAIAYDQIQWLEEDEERLTIGLPEHTIAVPKYDSTFWQGYILLTHLVPTRGDEGP